MENAGHRDEISWHGIPHRRLTVYSRSVEWTVRAYQMAERLPYEWRALADQIRRAAMSIPLNIAEGISESSPREQSRSLRIARRSAAECDAAFNVLLVAGLITTEDSVSIENELNQISAMITGLIRQSNAIARSTTRRSSRPRRNPADPE